MDMYKRASKLKLRFATNKGELKTEDLHNLSLQSLDQIARKVNSELKGLQDESFIGEDRAKSAKEKELELSLDILKDVIKDKKDAEKAAADRAVKQARIARLEEHIRNKQDDALAKADLADLEKELAQLTSE